MLKLNNTLTASAAAVFVLTCLAAAPAHAAPSVTYVSGKGIDTGTCATPATACRTFQFAVNQTVAGGEVKAIDPAEYGPVATNKSISLTGVQGPASTPTAAPPSQTLRLVSLVSQLASLSRTWSSRM